MTASVVLDSVIGHIEIVYQNEAISRINLNSSKTLSEALSDFESEIMTQIQRYFRNASYQFNLPIELKGTAHQTAVWHKMLEIPVGRVKTYGEIAKQIGSSGQAVGNACRNNPIPIIVPCHRVVAANSIGGFAGETEGTLLNIKQSLLTHEGVCY